jgi:hypothetical protein
LFRKATATLISTVFSVSLATATENPLPQPKLSATEIVEKNVAARGGLQAWREVQTLSYAGTLRAGGIQRATPQMPRPRPKGRQQFQLPRLAPQRPVVPFLIELARPRKQRIELQFKGQTAVQVFDGAKGWRLRPLLNPHEAEPFTQEEIDVTSTQADLDGPLVDYAAKGTKVELDGMENVEDRETYKLKLTLNNGKILHVWIDSQTFLETKIEGAPRRLGGVYHPVEIYYRDYRSINGLQIPFLLETRVLPVSGTAAGFRRIAVPAEKMVIDRVIVNPELDPSLFLKAGIESASGAE